MKKKVNLTDDILKTWSEMTDENLHTEVRIEMAKKFNLDCIEDGPFAGCNFVEAFENQKKLRSALMLENLTLAQSLLLTGAMILEIERKYGKTISDKVLSCL